MSVPQPGDLIRAARLDIGWSTAALATAAGLTPGALRALEQGAAVPSAALLRHVLAAARTRPSIPLAFHADAIIALGTQHRIEHIRVFGSIVRGRDTPGSDIDLLVSPLPGVELFDLGGFAHAVEELTGFPVDVLVDGQDLAEDEHFAHVLREAVRL